MAFTERPVPSQLRRYLRRIRWVHQLPRGLPYRRYPDGESELIVRFGAGPTEATLIGTRTEPLSKTAQQQANFLLLRFRAGGAYPFFNVPMCTLADQVLPVREFWRDSALLHEAADFASVERASLELLQRVHTDAHAASRKVRQAVRHLQLAEHIPSASELARELGASDRNLRRAFSDVVGMPPKRFLRIVRFQRALALLRAGAQLDWSALAQQTGYFDQAHLIAEFRALSGVTPSQLLLATRRASVT